MDRYLETVATFNKFAERYKEKYWDVTQYQVGLDRFCEGLTQQDAAVLEIACGPGNVSHYLLEKRPDLRLHGIDLAPDMVQLARELNPGARYSVCDSREVSSLDEQFDAAICAFGLPYLSEADIDKLLEFLGTHLAQPAILYLSTMEGNPELSGFETTSTGERVFINYHTAAFLRQSLHRAGFAVDYLERHPLPAEQAGTADLCIVAHRIQG